MPSNPFDNLFGYLGGGGSLGDVVKKAASKVLPACHFCGEQAYVAAPCVKCGHYSCIQHGFFRSDLKSICAECAIGLDPDAGRADGYPWDVLRIPPTREAGAINRAFRKLAGKYHPDHCQNDPGAADGFRALTIARDEALAIAKES